MSGVVPLTFFTLIVSGFASIRIFTIFSFSENRKIQGSIWCSKKMSSNDTRPVYESDIHKPFIHKQAHFCVFSVVRVPREGVREWSTRIALTECIVNRSCNDTHRDQLQNELVNFHLHRFLYSEFLDCFGLALWQLLLDLKWMFDFFYKSNGCSTLISNDIHKIYHCKWRMSTAKSRVICKWENSVSVES